MIFSIQETDSGKWNLLEGNSPWHQLNGEYDTERAALEAIAAKYPNAEIDGKPVKVIDLDWDIQSANGEEPANGCIEFDAVEA